MNDREFTEALHKFREEPITHPLDFRPSIERFLDLALCCSLSACFHRESKWERSLAVASLAPSLPDERGVYMFVWRPPLVLPFETGGPEQPWWVLYVGRAGSEFADQDTIRSRYMNEYRHIVGGDVTRLWDKKPAVERNERLARYLTLRPLEYWFLLLSRPADVHILERKLIRMFSPPLNRQLVGPRLRLGTPVPAF